MSEDRGVIACIPAIYSAEEGIKFYGVPVGSDVIDKYYNHTSEALYKASGEIPVQYATNAWFQSLTERSDIPIILLTNISQHPFGIRFPNPTNLTSECPEDFWTSCVPKNVNESLYRFSFGELMSRVNGKNVTIDYCPDKSFLQYGGQHARIQDGHNLTL